MDGAEGLDGVYVLAATRYVQPEFLSMLWDDAQFCFCSRPDLIDPALLRPGRLDKSLLCDMPNAEDRLDILRACSRKIALSPDVDLNDYVQKTEGYSGADLQAVLYNAHLACVHSNISDAKFSEGNADKGDTDGEDVEYVSLGGSRNLANGSLVKSKAERAQITKRVRLPSTRKLACTALTGI